MTKEQGLHERATRRGIQIFKIALEMEVGEELRNPDGMETLFTFADAIARVAAMSTDPRKALSLVTGLFDKIEDSWFSKHSPKTEKILSTKGDTLAEVALEMALGQDDPEGMRDVGEMAVRALKHLVDAIVYIAALNSNPRQIIEYVVHALDETDVDAARKKQLK